MLFDSTDLEKYVDENTIGVVTIMGVTYNGLYEPVKKITAKLDEIEKETGLDIKIHVDGASEPDSSHRSASRNSSRLFKNVGHEVRLIAPKFVSPYRLSGKAGKNDAADAQAICEAVQRPHMRFVSIKSEEQQSIQCLHRARRGLNEERTAVCNRIRGLLAEFGVIAPLSPERLRNEFESMKVHLPTLAATCMDELFLHIDNIERRLLKFDRLIKRRQSKMNDADY